MCLSKLFWCIQLFLLLAFATACAPREESAGLGGCTGGKALLQRSSRIINTSDAHVVLLESAGPYLNGSARMLTDDPSTPWISYPHWNEEGWAAAARKSAQAAAQAAQQRGNFRVFFLKFHKVGSTSMTGLLNRCSGVTFRCGLVCGGECQDWEKPVACTGHVTLQIFRKYIENFPPRLRNQSALSTGQNIEYDFRDSRLDSITRGVREAFNHYAPSKSGGSQHKKIVDWAWTRLLKDQRDEESDASLAQVGSENDGKGFQEHLPVSDFVAHGRHGSSPVKLLVVTMLRDPLERVRSLFYFTRAQKCWGKKRCLALSSNFSHWMRQKVNRNEYAIYLGRGSAAQAKITLATQFDIVGILERFDESIVELSRLLQVPYEELKYRRERSNTKNKLPWTEEERAIAKERLKPDLDIYSFADKFSTTTLVSGAWKSSLALQEAIESYRNAIAEV